MTKHIYDMAMLYIFNKDNNVSDRKLGLCQPFESTQFTQYSLSFFSKDQAQFEKPRTKT